MTTSEKVLSMLPDGKFVPRILLIEDSGVDDRTLRKTISKLRADGHIIINQSDGNGYCRLKLLKKNYKAISEWYKQEKARVKRICIATAPARRYLRDIDALFGVYKKAGKKCLK